MTPTVRHRAATFGRASAAAMLAVALAACLQRSRPGTASSLVAALAVVTAAFAMGAGSSTRVWRVLALASAGLFLVAANDVAGVASPLQFALSRAAGPLAVAAAAAAILPTRAAMVALSGGAVAGLLHLALFDPFLDATCQACSHASIAIWADVGTARTAWTVGWVAILVGVALGARSRPVFAAVALTAGAAYAWTPTRPGFLVVVVAAAVADWLPRILRARRRHARLTRLLASYAMSGTDLTSSLRASFRDQGLQVGYPFDPGTGDGFVDATGEPLEVNGQQCTDISVDGEVLARITHQVGMSDRSTPTLDPITILTLYRHRSNAQLAARVRQLVERRRLVATTGLEARNALERDLHDGVQQELLALGLSIRLEMATCQPEDRRRMEDALATVHECVDQVRAISTGVSPPMLVTHGIRAAVEAFARRSSVDVDATQITAERFPAETELAAFGALSEALIGGATDVSATAERATLHLTATVPERAGDRWRQVIGVGSLTDLFQAMGGSLVVDEHRMEAMLPCVS